MAEPIMKWVGGKKQLGAELKNIITPELLEGHRYYEPFIGGGYLAFNIEHPGTVINDLNSELVNLYRVVRDNPNELIDTLKAYANSYAALGSTYYYDVRNMDRDSGFSSIDSIKKAARTLFLNKTCFNGLYRVNAKGYFNAPEGRTSSGKLPTICESEKILKLSKFLNSGVEIRNVSYIEAVKDAKSGDVLYLDPPYDKFPDKKAGFVNYQKDGWKDSDLLALKNLCDELVERGCHVIVSNNGTPLVKNLFSDEKYEIREVSAKRSINSDKNGRGNVIEVIIYSHSCK